MGQVNAIVILLDRDARTRPPSGGFKSVLVVGVGFGNEEAVKAIMARDAAGVDGTEGALSVNEGVMNTILAKDKITEITEAVRITEIANYKYNTEVISLLLARGTNIEITEVVLMSTTANRGRGKELIQLFLARDTDIGIPEPVLVAAAANI